MILFISFLIGIQIIHTMAASIAPIIVYPSCNSSAVKAAAGAALDQINSNRKEGYVLGLQRIFDVRELPQGDESDFNFLLDVLETKCHVLSRKPWKECEFREPHETVFGHCEILMRFNRLTNDYVLHRYNCFLHPHYPPICAGCPIWRDPSEDTIQKIAKECLDKFNNETDNDHSFVIIRVTKATSQVVSGIRFTVEFIIQETSCPKYPPDPNQCPLLPYEIAEKDLCECSVIEKWPPFPNVVSVQCNPVSHQPLHDIIETPPKQGTVVQVTGSPWRNCEDRPIFPLPEEEAKTTIPPNPRGSSESPDCPGKVAKEIPGLHLPSYSWQQDEISLTKSDV